MEKLIKKLSFMTFLIAIMFTISISSYATNSTEPESENTSIVENTETDSKNNTETEPEKEPEKSNTTNTGSGTTTKTDTTKKETLKTVYVDGEEVKNGTTIDVESDRVNVRTNIGMYYIQVNGKSSNSTVSLSEGKNTIVVTDSNGNKITIYINRKTSEDENKKEDTENKVEETKIETTSVEEFGLASLKVDDFEISPTFKNNVYTYNLKVKDVNSINVIAKANDANATVSISGTENLKEGENVVNIIVTSQDENEIKTYQIIVNKTTEVSIANEIVNKKVIVAGAVGLIVIIIIIVVIVRKKRDRDYYYGEVNSGNKKHNDEKKAKKDSNKGKRSKSKH